MKALQDLDQIFHVAFGYMASKALFSALHLGVFDALAEGRAGFAELADRTGAEERGLTTLLTALTATGLLEKSEAGWVNAPAAQMHLVSGSAGDLGGYLRHQIDRQMYPFLHNLTDVLRGRRDSVPFADYEAWFGDAEEASLYSESQHGASVIPAAMLAALVDFGGCRQLLDVGGGSGAFSIELCRLQPQLQAVILDFPNVLEVARRRAAEAGLSSRIECLPGNALTTDWPLGRDVVLFSYISGSVSGEGVGELYRRAHAALAPGGRVLVHDFLVDDDRTGPTLTAWWALQHLAFTPGAVSLTPAFVRQRLADAGFAEIEVGPFVPGMTSLVQARKPG